MLSQTLGIEYKGNGFDKFENGVNAMEYLGRVENGSIILDNGANLPNGARVRIELIDPAESGDATLYQKLQSVIGMANGLPADASRNVDHYLYGHPKK